MIRLKRIYDPAAPEDGARVLVDAMWPRGVRKAKARLDAWERDVAPSAGLRKWFGHRPERWDEFRKRYFAELAEDEARCAALDRLHERMRAGPLTLLFAAKDTERNNAVALKAKLEEKAGRS